MATVVAPQPEHTSWSEHAVSMATHFRVQRGSITTADHDGKPVELFPGDVFDPSTTVMGEANVKRFVEDGTIEPVAPSRPQPPAAKTAAKE